MKLPILFTATFCFFGFQKTENPERLVFETVKMERSSFCLYSDGKFYQASQSGCTGEVFSWGYWNNNNDTVELDYQSADIFQFDVVESAGKGSKMQVVRVTDCYNQPVRFQYIRIDTGWAGLYNQGFLELSKGQKLVYGPPDFEINPSGWDTLKTNSDTLTYKWRCNREVLESINGGNLYIDTTTGKARVLIANKEVRWL